VKNGLETIDGYHREDATSDKAESRLTLSAQSLLLLLIIDAGAILYSLPRAYAHARDIAETIIN
jgi:hypothetical protein